MTRCQCLVVGSGPGGAVTGALLAEAGKQVTLLEEGGRMPAGLTPFSRGELEAAYRNGGLTAALGPTKVQYVEGRCLGGGSEINSGLYHRLPEEILDAWRRRFGVDGLEKEVLLPLYERNEQDLTVSYSPFQPAGPATRLRAGAARQGWSSQEVPRWVSYAGLSAPEGRFGGRKQSMAATFLRRFEAGGGDLRTHHRVQQIRRESGGWRVEAYNGQAFLAEELFLCAGAVQTPALLDRSGLRPPGGFPLQLHPTAKLVVEFPEEVNADGDGVASEQVKQFAPWLSFGCSISTPEHLQLALLDHPQARRRAQDEWRRFAIYYAAIVPTGKGRVQSLPGHRDALVRYQLSQADHALLSLGLQRLTRLFLEDGAVAVYPSLSRAPGQQIPRGTAGLMTIHLFSSIPLAEDARLSPVDSFGRWRGLRGLRIHDASLLCSPPGVNPQGAVMALARRNTAHFLGQL